MTEKRVKKHGDRNDGYLVPETDPMHMIMPFVMGGRADNEAVLGDLYDMEPIIRFIAKKNETSKYKYTYFHVITAALAKTVYIRPLMNRFIAGHRYYDRNKISFSFTAKNKFSDNSNESLVILSAEDTDESLVDQIHNKICGFVYKIRSEEKLDDTTDALGWITKIPRFFLRFVVKVLNWLDYHGMAPKALDEIDPFRTSAYITNLGSIDMDADYHHLINWGTNSIFIVLNKVRKVPFFNEDGTYEMKNAMKIAFTIDERIADGYYFAKSIKIFKYLIAHPELLDQPLNAPIDTDAIFEK